MPVAYVDHHGGTTEHRTAAWARCTCGWCGADHHRPAAAPAAELHEMTTAATGEATRHARTHLHGMFVRVGSVVHYAHLTGGREWLRITAINAYGPLGPEFRAGTADGYISRIRRTRQEPGHGPVSRAPVPHCAR
ncbi:hypothetical protein ABZV91_06435 [Nocardia sp. NPDC004568]|uniref:hypothetical protein n=1 Tax=Nocardia sp. NPDC004568 TaxID=3154551 RepID=UPI0033B5D43F